MSIKAWQLPRPGHMSGLTLTTVAAPTPPPAGCILVKVVAAGLNPADYKVAELGLISRLTLCYPHTPGMDLSGVVLATGSSVTDVQAGDLVTGRANPLRPPGSLAEQIVLAHDEYARIAPSTSLDSAAALPTAALTAYQTLQPYVKPGDRVFINGGAGGVGSFAIQIAKKLGCHVTTSCSGAKEELCRRLGADEVVDYTATDVAAALAKTEGFAHMVDNVGQPDLYTASKGFLRPDAKYVFVGGNPTVRNLLGMLGVFLRPSLLGGGRNKIVMYITKSSHDDLALLAGWLDQGTLNPVLGTTYEFDDAKAAFDELKKGKGGKVLVHVSKP